MNAWCNEKLAEAISNKDIDLMQEVSRNSYREGDMRDKTRGAMNAWCREKLAEAVANKDVGGMLEVYRRASDNTVKLKAQKAVDVYCDKKLAEAVANKDVGGMWKVVLLHPDATIEAKALRAIIVEAVANKDVRSIRAVYKNSLNENSVRREALREIVLLTD